jgi:hypothetical protein
MVDPEFGTGCVKITPAHDPNDFLVGLRHDLEQIQVVDDKGIMNDRAVKYAGLDRFEARAAVVRDLEAKNLLLRMEEHDHAVGHCYRCRTIIEPYLSEQWFVRAKPLAEAGVQAVKDGRIRWVPEQWASTYFQWMENIRDWCISGSSVGDIGFRLDVLESAVPFSWRTRHRKNAGNAAAHSLLRKKMCSTRGSAARSGLFPLSAGPSDGGIGSLLSHIPSHHRIRHHLLLGVAHDHDGIGVHG